MENKAIQMLYAKLETLSRWDQRWVGASLENSEFSKDPGTKCGALIVDPMGRQRVSEGFNGFPQKIEDDEIRLGNREFKLAATIHAEMNAILFAKCDLTHHMMFSSTPPCDRCSAHIIQTGINRVVWVKPSPDYWARWEESSMFGRNLMADAQIHMTEVI